MLILFDIDGTLLHTGGAGTHSIHDATREMFGETMVFEGVEVAGRIDPQIWSDVCRVNGIADPERHHDRFRAVYRRHLARRIRETHRVTALPGVAELLDAVAATEGLTPGLLTGNYPETGRLKIETAGLDPDLFMVAAWGSDAPTRRDLPAVAMARYTETTGDSISSDEVVIVGDTPHDVDCARAHGCRALAVATGSFSREDLEACAPDLLLEDLSQTAAVVSWMLDSKTPAAH